MDLKEDGLALIYVPCSPRARGWTGGHQQGAQERRGVPRVRGDGPVDEAGEGVLLLRVPRVRGDGPKGSLRRSLRMTAMLTADVDDADRAEGAMRGIQSLA